MLDQDDQFDIWNGKSLEEEEFVSIVMSDDTSKDD
jgi:hypothetical protein